MASNRTRRTKGRSIHDQSGAVIVEGAIGGMVFVMILLAVVEFGLTFFSYITASNASKNGAHEAAIAGNDPLADFNILQKVKLASTTMSATEIQKIVIYKASNTNYAVPSSCLTGAVAGTCNYYTGTDMGQASSNFGCGASSPDRYWCPTSRLVGAGATGTPPTGPPDYVGVYIQGRHNTFTNFYATSYSFSNKSVLRIEAQTP